MKNKFLYLLLLLAAMGSVMPLSAANIRTQDRLRVSELLTRIVGREVMGATVQVEAVKASRGRVRIYASVGLSYYPFREQRVAAIYDSVRAVLPHQYRKARLELYTDTREISDLVPMAYRSAGERRKLVPFTNRSERPLVTPQSEIPARPKGLSGRHIALWQSHGRYFDQLENRWRWQRSQLWQTCEDLYTQSYVVPYLVPMLERAGACVLLPRERDVQKFEVLADNDVADQYRESASGVAWQAGGRGFAHRQQVYRTGDNPFFDGTTRRVVTVSGAATAQATWTADIPQRGEYALYVSYESVPQSADDALYTVYHLGGESRFAVNQTMGGGTWIYLGRFLFEAGAQEVASLSNSSRRAGRVVSADAVKIGGGYGNIARTVCDSLRVAGREYAEETSGYPRFCEGARYWLQWAGFDPKVYTPKENKDDYKDDYMSRAHWVNALAGGSERMPDSTGLRIPLDMALAFHSDAGVRPGDEVIGTLGIFFTREAKGRFDGGADRYRSRDLTDLVMTQIVNDIRSTWEPEWRRRGLWNRAYYEARIPGVPTMLLELLSHQNFADMRYGSDPRFKFLVSRAIYKGILRHIAAQYDVPYVVQPLPVEAFSVRFSSENGVRLEWSAVADPLEPTATPTGYMVYTRIGAGGFDDGRYTDKPFFEAEQQPGVIYSYRITAVNEGGESFPGETLAACRIPQARGCVLVVNGFDRISAPESMRGDSLAGFYNDLDAGVADRQDISFIGKQRVFDLSLARCEDDKRALGASLNDFETEVVGGNTFDYPYLHGRAIAAADYSFCSTSARAVEQGKVPLTDYRAVDLILGKQRAVTMGSGVSGYEFKTFCRPLQRAIRDLIADGGALFASGCYVASDCTTGAEASDADRAFVREVLHCTWRTGEREHRGRARVVTSHGGFSRDEYRFANELSPDRYAVETADAFDPAGEGAFAVMRYAAGKGSAGVAFEGAGRSVVLGFPFESLDSEPQRDRLMRDVLEFLLPAKKK